MGMPTRLWPLLICCIALRARGDRVCLSKTSSSSAEILTGKVKQIYQDVATLSYDVSQMKADAAALDAAYAELQQNQQLASSSLTYQLQTVPVDCSEEQSCHTCTNGSFILRCRDGLLHDKELQTCEDAGVPLPQVLSVGVKRVTKNLFEAVYALNHRIVSCCFFQDTLTECTCEQGFESQSLCSTCKAGHGGQHCTACPASSDGALCSGHGTCNFEAKCECLDGFDGDDCSTCKRGFGGPSCLRCDRNRLVFEGKALASCCPSTYNCTCENSTRGCDAAPAPIEDVKTCLTSPPHNYDFAGTSPKVDGTNITYYLISHPLHRRTWLDTFFRVYQCGGQMAWTVNRKEYLVAESFVRSGGRSAWVGGRLRTDFAAGSMEGWGWVDSSGLIWDVIDPEVKIYGVSLGSMYIDYRYQNSGLFGLTDSNHQFSFVLESGRTRRCRIGHFGESCLPCPGLESTGAACSGHGECHFDDGICACSFGYSGRSCTDTSLLDFVKCSGNNYTYIGNTSDINLPSGVVFHLLQHHVLLNWTDQFQAAVACGGKLAWTLDRPELDAALSLIHGVGDSWIGGVHDQVADVTDTTSWWWVSDTGELQQQIEPSLWTTDRPALGSDVYISSNETVTGLLDATNVTLSYIVLEWGRKALP